MSTRILLVEDEEIDALAFQRAIDQHDWIQYDTATTISEAQQALENTDYDAVVTDLNLPDSSGLNTVLQLTRYKKPVLVYTGFHEEETARKAVAAGAIGVVPKSADSETLLARLAIVREYVQRVKLEPPNRECAKQACRDALEKTDDLLTRLRSL